MRKENRNNLIWVATLLPLMTFLLLLSTSVFSFQGGTIGNNVTVNVVRFDSTITSTTSTTTTSDETITTTSSSTTTTATKTATITATLTIKINPLPPVSRLTDTTALFNGNGGTIAIANGFRLSKFTQQTNRLDGYAVRRQYTNGNIIYWGSLSYTSVGYMTVDFTIFPFLPPLFSMKIAETFTVVDDGTHNCPSIANNFTVCTSSGWMIKHGSGIWADNGQLPITILDYVITKGNTNIIGYDSNNNKILEIDNINLLSLKAGSPVAS